jgi:hypothetical protein
MLADTAFVFPVFTGHTQGRDNVSRHAWVKQKVSFLPKWEYLAGQHDSLDLSGDQERLLSIPGKRQMRDMELPRWEFSNATYQARKIAEHVTPMHRKDIKPCFDSVGVRSSDKCSACKSGEPHPAFIRCVACEKCYCMSTTGGKGACKLHPTNALAAIILSADLYKRRLEGRIQGELAGFETHQLWLCPQCFAEAHDDPDGHPPAPKIRARLRNVSR